MQLALFQPDPIPATVFEMRDQGALFVISHSGGKDSQAMTLMLLDMIPHDQLIVIHAPLGKVEWPGTIAHIQDTIPPDIPFILAPVTSGKPLLDRVAERGMFPDPARRWCTSDLKRGPIERETRRYLKANPQHKGQIVMCMGMRAEESPRRSKLKIFQHQPTKSLAGRVWFDWLPIHQKDTSEVFEMIEDAGQKPHWAYGEGMTRLSCSFCIMSSDADLSTAARLRPKLYAEYVALERRINHTLSPSQKFLPEIVNL